MKKMRKKYIYVLFTAVVAVFVGVGYVYAYTFSEDVYIDNAHSLIIEYNSTVGANAFIGSYDPSWGAHGLKLNAGLIHKNNDLLAIHCYEDFGDDPDSPTNSGTLSNFSNPGGSQIQLWESGEIKMLPDANTTNNYVEVHGKLYLQESASSSAAIIESSGDVIIQLGS